MTTDTLDVRRRKRYNKSIPESAVPEKSYCNACHEEIPEPGALPYTCPHCGHRHVFRKTDLLRLDLVQRGSAFVLRSRETGVELPWNLETVQRLAEQGLFVTAMPAYTTSDGEVRVGFVRVLLSHNADDQQERWHSIQDATWLLVDYWPRMTPVTPEWWSALVALGIAHPRNET